MTKYIIGTISELDTPLNPAAKGRRSLISYLGEISQEDMQKERDEILVAEKEDIRKLAPLVQGVLDEGNICVIGNEEKVKAESALFEVVESLL